MSKPHLSGQKNGRYKHGMLKTKEYTTWQNMKLRCLNKNATHYKHYGGRGIKICARWLTFLNFLEDMGKAPTAEHTIDRIDNNGDYCKSNCRWTTRKEQARNRRTNVLYNFEGKKRTLIEIVEIKNESLPAIRTRVYRAGMKIEDALVGPRPKRTVSRPLPEKSNHPERRKTHCANGHEYSQENTYVSEAGHRGCRICRKKNRRAVYERQRLSRIDK